MFLSSIIEIATFDNVVFVKTNRCYSYFEDSSWLLGLQSEPEADGSTDYVKLNYLPNQILESTQLPGYIEISWNNMVLETFLRFSSSWHQSLTQDNFFLNPHVIPVSLRYQSTILSLKERFREFLTGKVQCAVQWNNKVNCQKLHFELQLL